MADFLGVDIAGLVGEHLGGRIDDLVTLTHYTEGTRSATDPTAGTEPSSSTHRGPAFFDAYKDRQIDGKLVQRGDRKVVIIADTLKPTVTPAPGDEILLKGETLRIVKDGVEVDPAVATYTCQARRK